MHVHNAAGSGALVPFRVWCACKAFTYEHATDTPPAVPRLHKEARELVRAFRAVEWAQLHGADELLRLASRKEVVLLDEERVHSFAEQRGTDGGQIRASRWSKGDPEAQKKLGHLSHHTAISLGTAAAAWARGTGAQMSTRASGVLRRVSAGCLSELRKPLEVAIGPHASAVVLPIQPPPDRPGAMPVSAFVNRCPHAGTPLNMFPERFYDRSGEFLLCSTHGALFQPSDGLCVRGPCVGQCLTPLPVELEQLDDGSNESRIILLVSEHAAATSSPRPPPRKPPLRAETIRNSVPRPLPKASSQQRGGPPGTQSSLDDELDQLLRELDDAGVQGAYSKQSGMNTFFAPRGRPPSGHTGRGRTGTASPLGAGKTAARLNSRRGSEYSE